RVLQQLDSLTDGKVLEQTRLMTGASGGMIGAAYIRELFLKQKLGQSDALWQRKYADRIAKDLLNRVCFKIVTGLFLPTATERVGASHYFSDRGWSFDDQLIRNLGVFQDRRLCEYIDLEEQAIIPQMIFSPIVINDGRKMYISSMPVSYLMRYRNYDGDLDEAITGVDFRRFFRSQDADSLLFATALRMNASFPLITPYVRMPSDPPIQVIDAGVADNYGLETASRYLQTFADWYLENTDGVLLLQIRDSKAQSEEVPEYHRKNLLRQFLDPIGATYSAFSLSSDLANEQHIHAMDQHMKGRLEYACFQYEPVDSGGIRAALSWHLTQKEIDGIEASLHNEANTAVFEQVRAYLKVE
ncbi:MAG: patatin-like phospholipase family protein, partial [Bacteroidota bacterium]